MNVLNTGRLIQVGRNTGVSGIANLNGGTVTTPAIRGNSGNGVGYAIVPSAASGTGLGNYTISYNNGTLTVNPAMQVTVNSPCNCRAETFC